MASRRPRPSFAPLGKPSNGDAMALKGIIFDMDGTLCEPQNHMFTQMRTALCIPKTTDILTHLHSLPEPSQSEASERIAAIEREAMSQQTPQPGLNTLLAHLDAHDVRKAICTRNFDAPVEHLLREHVSARVRAFAPVVTRAFRPPKPSLEGLWHVACAWGLEEEVAVARGEVMAGRRLPVVMVGDSVDDVVAGYEAGALTVLLRSEGKEELEGDERTDVVIDRLDDLIPLLEQGLKSRRDE